MKEEQLSIRGFQKQESPRLRQLYEDTVRSVNSRDYSPEEIEAWLSQRPSREDYERRFLDSHTLIAESCGVLVGFGNMEPDGHLDCLYVHKDFQGKGIGSRLLACLETDLKDDEVEQFTVHASRTAKAFFEAHGYHLAGETEVVPEGVALRNFLMEKSRSDILKKREEKRQEAAARVLSCISKEELPGLLWELICLYEGFHFLTSKNLPFQYRIKGGELFCDRKAKSITQATVVKAYEKILAAKAAGDPITGPKKLSIFGAPYVWSILKTLDLT